VHNNKQVAVILINWNSFAVTNDCICSLQKATYPYFDIIVVDNGSQDGSADALLKAHPDIVLLKNEKNMGFTGGNNRGFVYAMAQDYTYVMLLNNDTFVKPDFLEPLVSYMDSHPETGVIQSRIFFNHNRELLWNGGSYYNTFWGITYTKGIFRKSGPEYEKIKAVDWVTGCAFFTRTSILKKVGTFSENFFAYHEDVDLSFRITKAGFDLIYHPDSIVYHIAGESGKQKTKGKEGFVLPIIHYLNIRNKIWILKAYTPWYCIPSTLLFNFFYCTGVMAYFVARFRFQKLKAYFRGIRDGLGSGMHVLEETTIH
jgi:GT2 family glycosyltransferase